jgi:hypothetical protein
MRFLRKVQIHADKKIYTLDTTKGKCRGTAEECADWLVKHQPAFESLDDLPPAVSSLLDEDEQGFKRKGG